MAKNIWCYSDGDFSHFVLESTVVDNGFAQSRDLPVATLCHAGTLTNYYGEKALNNAYADAADAGDVITLSAGNFPMGFGTNKQVTIRGVGYDTESGLVTCLKIEGWEWYIGGETTNITFEGVYINDGDVIVLQDNAVINFNRCKVGIRLLSDENTDCHYNITHSIVGESSTNGRISNSVVCGVRENCVLDHCVVYGHCPSSQYNNCIVIAQGDCRQEYTSVFNNCVCYNGTGNFLTGPTTSINVSNLNMFANPTGMDTFDITRSDYELTPEAQATYIGDDDTQVGIYGGYEPFTTRLSYPVISSFSVDRKSTTDGKLGVNISVKIPE